MITITKAISIIETTIEEIKETLIENFVDILQDCDLRDSEGREFHKQECNTLYGYLDQLDDFSQPGITQMFKDGMTPLLLNLGDFHDIEDWFRENDHTDNVLEIHIKNKAGSQLVINHDNISF